MHGIFAENSAADQDVRFENIFIAIVKPREYIFLIDGKGRVFSSKSAIKRTLGTESKSVKSTLLI